MRVSLSFALFIVSIFEDLRMLTGGNGSILATRRPCLQSYISTIHTGMRACANVKNGAVTDLNRARVFPLCALATNTARIVGRVSRMKLDSSRRVKRDVGGLFSPPPHYRASAAVLLFSPRNFGKQRANAYARVRYIYIRALPT